MSQYLGDISAYALAVSQGYTGTEEEYAELMASYATVGQTAVTAAQTATTKASEAATSATTATTKASEATTAATTATNKAAEAQADADAAALDASQAMSAASTATTKATEATTAAATATSAKTDAVAANTAAQSAKTAAQTAQAGAETAAASVQSSAAQIQTNADDISELKEDFTQMESDGVVPTAEQILSDKGVTDSVPYHYRKTGGDGADRLYDKIVGGSLAVNQLVRNGDFSNGSDRWSLYMATAAFDNNIATVVTDDTVNVNSGGSLIQTGITVFANHKYIVSATIKGDGEHRTALRADGGFSFNAIVNVSNDFKTFDGIAVGASDSSSGRVVITAYGPSMTILVKNVKLFDLTAMFGTTIADYVYSLETATAGAGVAWLKAHFPKIFDAGYIPYNAGTLEHVSGLSAHKMTGFNQWNEEWVNGRWAGNNGVFNPAFTSYLASKNSIHVLPNTTYYFSIDSSIMSSREVVYYDASDNWISDAPSFYENATFTTPSNCHYVRFNLGSAYGTTYNHDICINLSDPAKNGQYEPYKAHSYPLDSTVELRGLFKLDANNNLYADGDTYDADGTVTRKYGIVDLGSLTWTHDTSLKRFYAGISTSAKPASSAVINAISSIYYAVSMDTFGGSTSLDHVMAMSSGGNLSVRNLDLDSGTASAFKTAMSGVMLVYELATPTTEEADPYQHLQQCDPNGTEEYVSTGIVPVGHNSFYPENLRAKVEQLPWNFASLIAPTESTFVATRNYTTGSLFIVDNVLYKATANIANGGTITPNTNCTATTLAEIISALA